MKHALYCVAVACVLISVTDAYVFAEDKKLDEWTPAAVTKIMESIAVPESPAFSTLGVTPEKITRPGNGRELAIALLQGADDKGNFQNGLALDFSPYLLFFGKNLTLADYKASSLTQFMSHLQLSMGASKGADPNDKSSKSRPASVQLSSIRVIQGWTMNWTRALERSIRWL